MLLHYKELHFPLGISSMTKVQEKKLILSLIFFYELQSYRCSWVCNQTYCAVLREWQLGNKLWVTYEKSRHFPSISEIRILLFISQNFNNFLGVYFVGVFFSLGKFKGVLPTL